MEFTEYEKMVDSLDHYNNVKELRESQWAVTEKVHGANFSLHTDGITVQPARRRDFLKDENFYNYQKAGFMKDCPEKVKALFLSVQKEVGCTLKQVTVYGELYGGKYEHPDVVVERQGKRVKPVQGEIQYCPDIQYCAFDIAYNKLEEEEEGQDDKDPDAPVHVYLDFQKTLELFEQHDIPYLKPLFIGKSSDALNYELGFDSYVPRQLGLPTLPAGTNKAEGVVIRPMKEILCRTVKNHLQRVMIKLKVPEFDDRRDQKGRVVNERVGPPKGKQNGTKKGKAAKRPDKQLLSYLVSLTTEIKLISAISKVGYPESEDTEKLIEEEMFQDLLSDAFENSSENETIWEGLDPKKRESVSHSIRAKICSLIRKYKAQREEKVEPPT